MKSEKLYTRLGLEPGPLAFICRIKREKFSLVPGLEPGPLALRASALATTLARTSADL